jgi:hypothetical protein
LALASNLEVDEEVDVEDARCALATLFFIDRVDDITRTRAQRKAKDEAQFSPVKSAETQDPKLRYDLFRYFSC